MLPFKLLQRGDMVLNEDFRYDDDSRDVDPSGLCIVDLQPTWFDTPDDPMLWLAEFTTSAEWSFEQVSPGDDLSLFVSRRLT